MQLTSRCRVSVGDGGGDGEGEEVGDAVCAGESVSEFSMRHIAGSSHPSVRSEVCPSSTVLCKLHNTATNDSILINRVPGSITFFTWDR